jgi:RNA polymerase sigma factor (sigma-70 family)
MPTFHTLLRQLRRSAARPTADLTDGQLLEQFLVRHDELAFDVLVRRHGRMVLGVCQRVLRNRHDAEDAFQATFLVLVRKASSIVPRHNVANWLFGVAYRTALKARVLMARRADNERRMRQAAQATREEKVWQDLLPLLDQELERLPENYRATIILCDLEGKTRKEAAQQLGCPEGTVAGRLARGRVLLARRLARHGVAVPGGLLAVLLAERTAAVGLPAPLVAVTVRAAHALATGTLATGAISTTVATLSQGVIRTMLLSKLKVALTLVLAACLGASGAGLFLSRVLAEAPAARQAAAPPAPVPPPAGEPGQPAKQAGTPGEALPPGAAARLGSSRLRHGDTIFFLHYLAGDKQLLTAGLDNTIRLWEVATGKELRRFEWLVNPGAARAPLEEALDKMMAKDMAAMGMPKGLLGQLGLGADRVFPVAVSPDGKYVAAHKRGAPHIWDTATGKRLHPLAVAPKPANDGGMFMAVTSLSNEPGLAFSSDSKRLLVASAGNVQVWDVATGKRVGPPDPQANLFDLGSDSVVSPDGKYLAWQTVKIQDPDFGIKVKDLTTGKTVAELKTGIGGALHLQFAPDGKTLAWTAVTGGVHLYEIGKDREPRVLSKELRGKQRPDRIKSLCFSPDSKTLAISHASRTADLWDVATGTRIRQIGDGPRQAAGAMIAVAFGRSPLQRTVDLAFSADGKTLAASFGGTHVRQFEVASGKEILSGDGGHQKPISGMHVSARGRQVTTCAAGDAVRVWDLDTGEQARHLKLPGDTTCVALAGDAKMAATAAGARVEIWDVAGGKRLKELTAGNHGVVAVAMGGNGQTLQPVAALALSADGKTLALRDQESQIHLWDVASGKEVRALAVGEQAAGKGNQVAFTEVTGVLTPELAFSPDGRYLLAADAHHRLCLWEVASGARLWEVTLPAGPVVDRFTFSPNGRAVAAVHHDGTVTVYETTSGEKRCRLGQARGKRDGGAVAVMVAGRAVTLTQNPSDMPVAAAFSPDSRFLVATHSEPVLHLWDVVAGKEVATFTGHQGGITAAAFTPDGKQVVSACLDTTALVWDTVGKMKTDGPAGDKLDPRALEALQSDLGGKDGARAFAAVAQLLRHPQQAAALAERLVQPVPAPDAKQVAQLVGALNHPKFDVRQKAAAELEKLGDIVVPELKKLLQGDVALEARQRVETLLKRLTQSSTNRDLVCSLRVLELLELQGGPEARRLLAALASGAPGARLTTEAAAALQRLTP